MSRAGSIKRDASGRWAFVVDTTPPGAARRRQVRKRGFAAKREAQEALTATLAAVQSGGFVAPDRMTVGEYLERWLDGLVTVGLRPSTIDGYRWMIARYVPDDLGATRLQDLGAVDFDRLYSALLASGGRNGRALSSRTVRYLHSARSPEMTVWTPAETKVFLQGVAEHHHGVLWHVSAMTGLRRGEVCGLQWSDIDLDLGVLRVRRALVVSGQRVIEGEPKTKRSRRTVNLDPGTVTSLRAHRRAQLEQRMMMGAGFTDRNFVFCAPDGQPWHPGVVGRAFTRKVRTMPGLPRIRMHDLRHGHASHLLAAGVNVKVVSERLGHASTSFTLDTYGHVLPGQQADAAAAAASLVGL